MSSGLHSAEGVRLNKFISSTGHCSRREADKLIKENRVKLNGKASGLGSKVTSGDVVTVDGFEIYGSAENKSDRIYIVYNKPIGITCTTEQNVKGNIVDAVDHDHRIFPVGRLDKPSEGLILLTSDGDIVNKILRAENAHDKEYLVTVNKPIGPDFASKMSKGIPVLDKVTKPCKVSVHSKFSFKITLTQGLNRQIRRMCEYLGYEVKQLQRLRIMNIQLGRLKPGQWRNLTREEMGHLNKAIAGSSGESSATKKPARSSRKPSQKSAHRAAQKPASRNGLKKAKSDYRGKGPNTEENSGRKSGAKKSRKKTSGAGRNSQAKTGGGKVGSNSPKKSSPSARRRK